MIGWKRLVLTGCAAAAVLLGAPPSRGEGTGQAGTTLAGPVAASVLKVRDGDTVEVEAFVWPQQVVRTAVRLRGVDAPELKARCSSERTAAEAARDRLSALLARGDVELAEVSGDKYFGRVLARVSASGVPDVARQLLDEGLVAAYRGEKRRDWCAGAAASALETGRSRTPG